MSTFFSAVFLFLGVLQLGLQLHVGEDVGAVKEGIHVYKVRSRRLNSVKVSSK